MGQLTGAFLSALIGSRFVLAGLALTAGYAAGDVHGQREIAASFRAAAATAEAEDLRHQITAGQAVAQAASARAQRSDAARAALQEKVDAVSTTLRGAGGPCELDRAQRLRLCDLAGLPGCAAAPAPRAGRAARRDGTGDP